MPPSLTHRNTPKTQGLQLTAWELPFMSEPTLKPWQGKAPEPVPALCRHPKLPPPSLFLNIVSPSKKSPTKKQTKVQLWLYINQKAEHFTWSFIHHQPAPSASSKSLPDIREAIIRLVLKADIACAKTDTLSYVPITNDLLHSTPNSRSVLAPVTVVQFHFKATSVLSESQQVLSLITTGFQYVFNHHR